MTEETKKNCVSCHHWHPINLEHYTKWGECQYPLPEGLEDQSLQTPSTWGERCPVWTPKEEKV